jgi:uncharacterized RDD family membrane protein YckC
VTTQPGWHPDPVPPQPGQAPQLRYWDGTRWTEHVAPAQPPVATPLGAPPAYQGTYGAASPQAQAAGYAYGAKLPPTTPDGVPLAGWWHRVGAYLIDAVIVGVIAGIIAVPWLRDLFHAYRDWIDDALDESSTTIDTSDLQRDIAGPLAVITLINLAVGFAYHVGFLMWKQATPGKLMVGLRVRLREQPGPMPIGTVLLRWLGQFGVGIAALVPVVGSVFGLYPLLDDLWPLWDDKKQAIHDKLAKTNVVRIR